MSIICTRCGGTQVVCEATINPNTKVITEISDDSLQFGRCETCTKRPDGCREDKGRHQERICRICRGKRQESPLCKLSDSMEVHQRFRRRKNPAAGKR